MSKIVLEDYLHPFKDVYRKSPWWVKQTIGRVYATLPLRIRYGGTLNLARHFLEASQWWSHEQHRAYQLQEMKKLLDHAYKHVPYYRRTWQQAGIAPADIRSLEDVQHLPFLTKEQVREHKEELVAENYRHKLLPFNTGGSTGQPLEFYWEHGRTRSLERAFMWRQWKWAGFEYGQRTAVLRGQTVAENIHFDPIDNHLFLSGFDLTASAARHYLDVLRNFRPISLQAYPATATVLANYMKQANELPPDSLRVVLCGSENLYPAQRALLEEVFRCRVYSWYGLGESVCLAGGCEQSDAYHVYTEYGYTELIDNEGNPLPWREGARGELVATGFNNWAMPLIRYRTADVAIVGPDHCSCGRNYPLLSRIEGRKQEYIVAGDGRLVALTAFIFGQHYPAFAKIRQMQIVQERKGAILVRLAVTPHWDESDASDLRQRMLAVLGGSKWDIELEYVAHIELTERGKHRFVVQQLPLDGLWSGKQDA